MASDKEINFHRYKHEIYIEHNRDSYLYAKILFESDSIKDILFYRTNENNGSVSSYLYAYVKTYQKPIRNNSGYILHNLNYMIENDVIMPSTESICDIQYGMIPPDMYDLNSINFKPLIFEDGI